MLRLIFVGALALLGCARPLVFSGWAQVDRPGGGGGVAARYHDRFSHHPFSETDPGCGALVLKGKGPVLVLVPGLRGDGVEFEEALVHVAWKIADGNWRAWFPESDHDHGTVERSARTSEGSSAPAGSSGHWLARSSAPPDNRRCPRNRRSEWRGSRRC